MEPQEREPPLSERGSATSGVRDGERPSGSTEGVDGGSGRSGIGRSNGTHDASVGDAKIGDQPHSASAANDATLRWARTILLLDGSSPFVRCFGERIGLHVRQEGCLGNKLA